MTYAVIGSRGFSNYPLLVDVLLNTLNFDIKYDHIVSGGADGADCLARKFAEMNGFAETRRFTEFLPLWDKYGKAAGPIRNEKIIRACDEVVVFWDGNSAGTRSALKFAKKHKKPVHIYWF